MANDIVKFSDGKWHDTFNNARERGVRNIGGYIAMLPKPSKYSGQDERYHRELDENFANAILISNAPKMFWILVTRAEETGEQYLFDVLSGIVGHEITYEEMCTLAEDGHRILQEWHKEELKEKEVKNG